MLKESARGHSLGMSRTRASFPRNFDRYINAWFGFGFTGGVSRAEALRFVGNVLSPRRKSLQCSQVSARQRSVFRRTAAYNERCRRQLSAKVINRVSASMAKQRHEFVQSVEQKNSLILVSKAGRHDCPRIGSIGENAF